MTRRVPFTIYPDELTTVPVVISPNAIYRCARVRSRTSAATHRAFVLLAVYRDFFFFFFDELYPNIFNGLTAGQTTTAWLLYIVI